MKSLLYSSFAMAERKYFLGDLKEIGKKSKGYFTGFFMKDNGFPELAFEEVELAVINLPELNDSLPHFHKISTEITIVLAGTLDIIIDQKEKIRLEKGQFLVVYPWTILQNPSNAPDTQVFVVKFPSTPGDKYYSEL